MTTPDRAGHVTAGSYARGTLVALEHVYFVGPVPLHGRLVREIVRGKPMASPEGVVVGGWEPHLHEEWACVVVEAEVDDALRTALVPLHSVRSMTLALEGSGAEGSGAEVAPLATESDNGSAPVVRRGRARTKRLDFVRD